MDCQARLQRIYLWQHWKKEFLSKAALVFTKESPDLSKDKEIHELHARIGELDVMVDFLKKRL